MKLTMAFVLAVGISAMFAPRLAIAQGAGSPTAEAEAAAAKLKLQLAQSQVADQTLEAVQKLLQEAKGVDETGLSVAALLAAEPPDRDAIASEARPLATALETLSATASATTKAARTASAVAGSDVAKLRAVRAVEVAEEMTVSIEKAAKSASESAKDLATETATVKAGKKIRDEAAAAVEAAASLAASALEAASQAAAPDLPVLTDADQSILGALRVRIVGGAILSNGGYEIIRTTGPDGVTSATAKSNQFSQAAAYFAIESQPRIAGWRYTNARGHDQFQLDAIANARLTTIAVSQSNIIEVPTGSFLASEKAVQVQLGLNAGWNFGRFESGDSQFHWSLALTGQYGFQSVTDANRSLRVWDLQDDVFESFGGGARLTLYQDGASFGSAKRRGWSPTAYLEVFGGDFENFDSADVDLTKPLEVQQKARDCLRRPAECLASGPPAEGFSIPDPLRWVVTVRLMLSYAYLGMDLNTGSGRDDMRVIGGISVGLDQLMQRK